MSDPHSLPSCDPPLGPKFDSHRLAGQQLSTFYCGDDAAKAAAASLLRDLDLGPIDAGPLSSARFIEPACMLIVPLAYGMKLGPNIRHKVAQEIKSQHSVSLLKEIRSNEPQKSTVVNPSRGKRVAIVIANPTVSTTTGGPVGFWWSELTHPYYRFTEEGYEVEVFSPLGGKCEADALSDPRDASGYSSTDLISSPGSYTAGSSPRALAPYAPTTLTAPGCTRLNAVRKIAPTGIAPLEDRGFLIGFPGLLCLSVAASLSGNGSAQQRRKIQGQENLRSELLPPMAAERFDYVVDDINKLIIIPNPLLAQPWSNRAYHRKDAVLIPRPQQGIHCNGATGGDRPQY